MKTVVISARVPKDIAELFANNCKQRGTTKSKLLVELLSTPNIIPVNKLSQGGKIDMPEEIENILSGVGGIAIGTLVYHSIQYGLQNKYSKEDVDMYSIIGAIAVGLGGAMGISSILKGTK